MFLAVRPRSVAETRRRLRHLGYQESLVETVVERLRDGLPGRRAVRARLGGEPRSCPATGRSALRRELALKGIDRETAREVLRERSDAASEEDAARALAGDLAEPSVDRQAADRLLQRKSAALLREMDPRKRRQKAYALLARNGFDPDVCREAVAAMDPA